MEMMTLAGTAQENGAASTHLGQAMAEEVHHLQHSNPLPLGYATLLVPNRAKNADLATHQQHAEPLMWLPVESLTYRLQPSATIAATYRHSH